jgi:hypothetical protein
LNHSVNNTPIWHFESESGCCVLKIDSIIWAVKENLPLYHTRKGSDLRGDWRRSFHCATLTALKEDCKLLLLPITRVCPEAVWTRVQEKEGPHSRQQRHNVAACFLKPPVYHNCARVLMAVRGEGGKTDRNGMVVSLWCHLT